MPCWRSCPTLADIESGAENAPSLADLEQMARRLSEAHDVLLRALESAEKS